MARGRIEIILSCALVAAAGALLVALIGSRATKVTRKDMDGKKKKSRQKDEEEMDPDMCSLREVHDLLDVIERDIVPLTCAAACQEGGTHTSAGAAVLREDDFSLLVMTADRQTLCPVKHVRIRPLFHPTIYVAMKFKVSRDCRKIPALGTDECVVMLSHKPCQICCQALSVLKFSKVFYLFDESSASCSSSMNSLCCGQSREPKSEEYPSSFVSLPKLIDDISNMRGPKAPPAEQTDILSRFNATQAEHGAEGEGEKGGQGEEQGPILSAKGMAMAAAVSREVVTARRRIQQLELVYSRIDEQRLVLLPADLH